VVNVKREVVILILYWCFDLFIQETVESEFEEIPNVKLFSIYDFQSLDPARELIQGVVLILVPEEERVV
jgi:hypothetical protein